MKRSLTALTILSLTAAAQPLNTQPILTAQAEVTVFLPYV